MLDKQYDPNERDEMFQKGFAAGAKSQPEKIEQDYHYQVDQQVSVNAFLDVDLIGETVRFQVTNRYGATTEKITKTVRANIEAYKLLRQEFPRQLAQPQKQQTHVGPPEPEYVPVDDGGYNLPPVQRFTAEKLSVRMEDGKFFYKVMGGNFTQYGISVWPEVLQAANLPTDTANMPSINGWIAEYTETQKDGKTRRKVTRLLPSK